MTSESCDIALPPPPSMPSWLGSLCSQIDSYKDFSLPQVFTPRNIHCGAHTGKIPSARTEEDSKVSSSQMFQNELARKFSNSRFTRKNHSVFPKNHDYQFQNSHDVSSHAVNQPETECVQPSQPWPSLQPVAERLSHVSRSSRGRNEDQDLPDSFQPWPSCEVKKPAPQACRITDSRLTYNCLTSSQNQQSNLRTCDSPPELFGDSPTYSPLTLLPTSSQNSGLLHSPVGERELDNLGWRKPKPKLWLSSTKNYAREKKPDTSMKTPATSYIAQVNSVKAVAVDGIPLSGENKIASRSYSSVDTGSDVASSSKRDQLGMSATPRMATHRNPYTPAVINFQGAGGNGVKLHSVEEIPKPFCDIFPFPFFNAVQSMAFDKLVYSDSSVVVSAPTGSGKTALFELAIVRLLLCARLPLKDIKVVYIGPMKSLCGERVDDWRQKLSPLGLACVELTGDSDLSDFTSVYHAQVICTTPEKWDSMTRRWKDNRQLFQSICLVCIDEVHIVGDGQRGATVEAVITRMKMVHTMSAGHSACPVRFVAVSATLPNTEDIGEWLSSHSSQAAVFKLGEEYRPVRLQRVVLGYPFSEGSSEFRFDINLTYKLHSVIDSYSHGKPSLVFCSSRKSCQQTAETLVKRRWGQSSFVYPQFRQEISTAASRIQEKKLSVAKLATLCAELLMNGVGLHHAGLEVGDRKLVEELFRAGKLAVLIATSTLSVGVNLPAHLVVVKATHLYVMGVAREYSDQQVLQMIGRAGRPQFDTSATVVIMTRAQLKAKYEALVNGTQVIESMLHKNLTEHVNVEVVLNTITDMADAASWLSHTLLHVRATKNPRHYGLPTGLSTLQVEQKLQDMCMTAINKLNGLHLVTVDPDTAMTAPTERGRLMARYCLEFQTIKHLLDIPLKSSMEHLIGVISNCCEFQDIQLRTSEKKTLNLLNKNKNQETIRYPLKGKVKTKQMKVNCLLQAGLGCLPVQDYSLSQDLLKIFRVGQRITKCLMELQWLGEDYSTLLHCVQLCKAFKARLWPDSRHVARQLEGIGPTISQALLQAGLTSFQLLEAADPQHLELVVNRHPPFGNKVRDAVTHLPRYELVIQQEKNHQAASAQLVISIAMLNAEDEKNHQAASAQLVISMSMLNAEDVRTSATCGVDHQLVFIIGDEDNTIVFKWKLSDRMLLSRMWQRKVTVKRALSGSVLHVGLISLDWAGLDIHTEYQPFYTSILHPYRHLKDAQSSAHTGGSTAAQPTKRGKPSTGPSQPKEGQKTGKLSGATRGQRADKIQQQLDVMHLKLQQFQRSPVPKLTHDTKGTAVLPKEDLHEQSMLQAKPWEEEPPSPEVNLQTDPWGSLVDDFWDESDFDEPPCKMPKKTDGVTDQTSVSDTGKQILSEDTRIPPAGTNAASGFRTQVSANKPLVFPPSHTSSAHGTGYCQTQAVTSSAVSGIISHSAGAAANWSKENVRPAVSTSYTSWVEGSNPPVGENMPNMNTDQVVGKNFYSREVSNPASVDCPNIGANPSISTNPAVTTLQGGRMGYSAATIPNPGPSSSMALNQNIVKNMMSSSHSHFAMSAMVRSDLQRSSAMPPPHFQTATGNLPPDRATESRMNMLETGGDMNAVMPRDPLMDFHRDQPAAECEQRSAKPEAPERRLNGRENVAQMSGFGWEHLQLYQSSRESVVNPDTQESSEGGEDAWSQSLVPEPQPGQLREAAAMTPSTRSSLSIQQRLVGITSPMVTGMPPYMAPLHNHRSCPRSISTANLLQGIF